MAVIQPTIISEFKTEGEIQHALIKRGAMFDWTKNEVVAINTTIGGFESDLIVVNKNRFMSEVEIKTSLEDFRRDRLKKRWSTNSTTEPRKYFYYAFPRNVALKIDLNELPKSSGLIAVWDEYRYVGLINGYYPVTKSMVLKTPEKLPCFRRVNESELVSLYRLMAYRFHSVSEKHFDHMRDCRFAIENR
jgi:hypothetical protein